MGTIKTSDLKCEECEKGELMLDDDGPAGKPVWICFACSRYWEDRNGKPGGVGEKLGSTSGGRMHIIWP